MYLSDPARLSDVCWVKGDVQTIFLRGVMEIKGTILILCNPQSGYDDKVKIF
jgi:hypothetical protein